MEELLNRILARVAQIVPTGGANPFPGVRRIDAIRVPAATGLPGGPSVSDLENYQVEFGRNRFGGSSGGWSYNNRSDEFTGFDVDLASDLAREVRPSRNPGFRSGPVVAGYQPPEPRSMQGGASDPENVMRGGFAAPNSDASQV